jgi:hypothetical protein
MGPGQALARHLKRCEENEGGGRLQLKSEERGEKRPVGAFTI